MGLHEFADGLSDSCRVDDPACDVQYGNGVRGIGARIAGGIERGPKGFGVHPPAVSVRRSDIGHAGDRRNGSPLLRRFFPPCPCWKKRRPFLLRHDPDRPDLFSADLLAVHFERSEDVPLRLAEDREASGALPVVSVDASRCHFDDRRVDPIRALVDDRGELIRHGSHAVNGRHVFVRRDDRAGEGPRRCGTVDRGRGDPAGGG